MEERLVLDSWNGCQMVRVERINSQDTNLRPINKSTLNQIHLILQNSELSYVGSWELILGTVSSPSHPIAIYWPSQEIKIYFMASPCTSLRSVIRLRPVFEGAGEPRFFLNVISSTLRGIIE